MTMEAESAAQRTTESAVPSSNVALRLMNALPSSTIVNLSTDAAKKLTGSLNAYSSDDYPLGD